MWVLFKHLLVALWKEASSARFQKHPLQRAAEDNKRRWVLHPEDERKRKIFPSGSLSAFLCHTGRNTFVQADGWKIQ